MANWRTAIEGARDEHLRQAAAALLSIGEACKWRGDIAALLLEVVRQFFTRGIVSRIDPTARERAYAALLPTSELCSSMAALAVVLVGDGSIDPELLEDLCPERKFVQSLFQLTAGAEGDASACILGAFVRELEGRFGVENPSGLEDGARYWVETT